MGKLKLVPNPTFIADVEIPIAGSEPCVVKMTFKHRTRKEWNAWIAAAKQKAESTTPLTPEQEQAQEVAAFMDVVTAWDLEEEFNRDNVGTLIQNYFAAASAAIDTYAKELWKAKVKN